MPNYQNTPETPLDSVFHALADPTRRAVIQQLSKGPATVSELAAPFDMALPSFLQHLKVLEDSGLMTSKKSGRVRTCEMDVQNLSAAGGWIDHQRAIWEGRLGRIDQYLNKIHPKEKD